MSFIFGANASRTAKVFTVFVYLSFIAVFYWAFTNRTYAVDRECLLAQVPTDSENISSRRYSGPS